MLSSVLIAALLSAGPPQSPAPDATSTPGPITLSSLLAELVDPRALSEFPLHPFRTRLASGRDPAALDVFETEGRRERVLLACEGPGALVRLWCAAPTGTLRVYVDGRPEPVLTAPLPELMAGAGGVPPPLAESRGGGGTLLLPIPFETSCRVTCSETAALTYQLTYRMWDAGTPVASFAAGDLERHAQHLTAAAEQLGRESEPVEGEVTHPFGHLIGSTGKDGAAIYAGLSNQASGLPSAVSELRLAVRDPNPEDGAGLARLLREALLILTFDGVDTVRVPLGDFFGSAPGLVPFESRFLSVQADEHAGLLTARFLMPFKESLFVRVESLCPEPLDLRGFVTLVPYEWTPHTLYFHTTWRGERDVPARPARDWSVARLERRGQLVGDALSFTNPTDAAWDTGATKLYVDGESSPSTAGGGAADYFGCGAGPGGPFATLFFGRTLSGGPGHAGTWSRYRLRALDVVPFFARLDFDRELPHASDEPDVRVDLSATVWYYADLAPARDEDDSPSTLRAAPPQQQD